MRLFNFVEGAWPRKGGVGIGCVPQIGMSLARQGIEVVLVAGGPPTPGYEHLVQADVTAALQQKLGRGSFAILSHRAWGRYAFAPSIFRSVGRAVARADVLALHSVYSFPVLAAYTLARLYQKPYILWPHGVLSSYQRGVGRRKKWLYDRLIARRILRGASAVICTGEGERQEVRSLQLTSRSIVISHGIDLRAYASLPERGRFRAEYLGGHQGPLILYLGRLAPVKNLELLIRAMAQVVRVMPEARLALVGPADPPTYARNLAACVEECGIQSQTVLTGGITSLPRKQEAFVDADVFVMPSHAENFCHALFEAMASALPALVSDSINYAGEVSRHGAGLALPRTPDDFARGMLEVLHNPELRESMRANARRLASNYSWDKAGERIARTVRSIVAKEPLPADLAATPELLCLQP